MIGNAIIPVDSDSLKFPKKIILLFWKAVITIGLILY